MDKNKRQFLMIQDTTAIDVLDESLYNYDTTVFSLTPSIQEKTTDRLIEKISQLIELVPTLGKAADLLKSKTEYILRDDLLSDEIKALLKSGQAEFMPCRDADNAVYLTVQATAKEVIANGKPHKKGSFLQNIPLGTKTIPTDIAGAAQCLSMQAQLSQISEGLKEISEACEFNFSRIIQGQRDDRIAKLFSSRSCFIQALALTDEDMQKQLLLQAIGEANAARAELAVQINSDIQILNEKKTPKIKDMEKIVYSINAAVIGINNAVQILLYSYQALGEHTAQLAVVKEHKMFTSQVLLHEIEHSGVKCRAWDLICSSRNSKSVPKDFLQLPQKLLGGCDLFLENGTEFLVLPEEDFSNEQ